MPKSALGYALLGLFIGGVIAVLFVVNSAANGGKAGAPLQRYAIGEMEKLDFTFAGETVPDARFMGPDGTPVSLSAYSGKTILVNFWATWCAPCEKEMPYLGALQRAKGSDDFEVVAISVDAEEDTDYARKRLKELAGGDVLDFNIATPESGYEVVYGAGARGFPTTILYNSEGIEIARLAGDADWSSMEAVAFIEAAKRR